MQYLRRMARILCQENKCIGCGLCIEVCPHDVFAINTAGRIWMRDQDACMECGACAQNCPVQAVEVKPGVG